MDRKIDRKKYVNAIESPPAIQTYQVCCLTRGAFIQRLCGEFAVRTHHKHAALPVRIPSVFWAKCNTKRTTPVLVEPVPV